MKRTKIGIAIFISVMLVGLVLGGIVMAKSSSEAKNFNKAEYVQDEIIVKFKQDKKPFRVIKVPKGKVLEEIRRYQKRTDVVYAEPNYIVSISLTPNDTDFSLLYGLHNTGQTGGTSDADIDTPEAWDIQTGSKEVIIAVIDTGVDYNHEDLIVNMWSNFGEIPGDGIDNDGNGYIDDVKGWDFYNGDNDPFDDQGHGTHCAGTIGAVGNNNLGVVGVNWNVKILPIKFLSSGGSGTTTGAIDAINYATLMGVDIMSNSWGGGGYSQALKDAIVAANESGILFVAAAGNSYGDNDVFPHYPSSYDIPNVVAIAATDHNDQKAIFSSYGAESVDLGAPGVNIYSTVPTGSCSLCDSSGYRYLNGTSMATPHVSGVAGLIKAQFPSLTSDGLKSRLLGGVNPIPSLDGITVTGGRVNAYNSLETDDISPSVINDLAASNPAIISVTLTWTATGDDGNIGTANSYDIRYSTSLITETNFESATQVIDEPKPQPSGSIEIFTVTGLSQSTTYYFAIKVLDNAGNVSGLSNVVSETTITPTIIFQDNMESGINGWVSENLWHQETYRYNSPITSWAYNTGFPDYNYDKGDNWGSLTSPSINLSAYNSAILTFQHFYQTEITGVTWDQRWIQVGVNGVFENVAQLSGDSMLTWNEYNLDISSYVGKSNVQVRFFFDTIDSVLNSYEGWYIDDVSIFGEIPGPQAPIADAGPDQSAYIDQTVTFDGSGSTDDGEIVSYDWDFGDGTTGSGIIIEHIYIAEGIYTVTLTITDNDGLTGQDVTEVTITSVPLMEVTITKHEARYRWDKRNNFGKVQVQIDFIVDKGSSNQVVLKEVIDGAGTWTLESSDVAVKISGTRYIWTINLDINGDVILDFGAQGIILGAGDIVQISKMKLLNDTPGSHTLTAQVLEAGNLITENSFIFTLKSK